MNPAVPLLLLLSLLPLARRRTELRLAWCVAGLAAMLLLSPALVEPRGVPSPAASAGAVAPWVGLLDPADGNPTLSDVTFQIQPWLVHLRAELRRGRLPFWNPYQFAGAPFWSNGQSAPLFPLHLLFAALPLQLGFVLLPWLRAVTAGAGAWALAREIEVPRREALYAAIVFPLSGMLSSFLLFPMANALCLVPWVLREVELYAARRGAWWRLAGIVGVQALGGHPETVAHTAMLAALYLLARGVGHDGRHRAPGRLAGSVRRLAIVVAAFAVGAVVAGIHLAPLVWNVAGSTRWQEWESGDRPPAATLVDVALRAVLPDLFGHPADGTWWGPFNYNATAVFAGIVTLPLAVAGAVERWRDPRVRGVAAATVAAALAAYQVFPVRELLLVVPGVRHMLHHRLLFAVDLGLALLAAAGLAALVRGHARGLRATSAVVLGALAVAWARHHEAWREAALVAHQARWTAWAIVALGGLALAARLARRRRSGESPRGPAGESTSVATSGVHANGAAAAPMSRDLLARAIAAAALAAVAGELVVAHARTNPALPVESLLPQTPAIAFLAEREGRVAAIDAALRPNAAMIHRLRDVRGDDTLKSARYERVYRSFGGASPHFFEPIVDWDDRWLDQLGVRWVLSAPGSEPPVERWTVAYDGPDARVFERATALPLVRWSDGGADGIAVAASEPGAWAVSFRADRPRVLVVAESWDAGWSGTFSTGGARDAVRAALAPEREALIGARVGPGSGELQLRYRPRGFALGAAASTVGVLVLLVAAVRQRRARGAEVAVADSARGEPGAGSAARARRGTRR